MSSSCEMNWESVASTSSTITFAPLVLELDANVGVRRPRFLPNPQIAIFRKVTLSLSSCVVPFLVLSPGVRNGERDGYARRQRHKACIFLNLSSLNGLCTVGGFPASRKPNWKTGLSLGCGW